MEDKNQQWKNCIQSLKSYFANYKTPSSKNALEWIYEAIAKYPNNPPTNITPSKDNVIVEINNGDYCCKLLFSNDSCVKRTDLFNNKKIEVCWI